MFPDIARDDVFRLETSRLWLRWPRASDAADLARIAGRREVAEMTARIPHRYPDGEAHAFVLRAREQNCRGEALNLVATLARGDRRPIGAISVTRPAPESPVDVPMLGYYFDPGLWGRGFATEAARAVVDAAFLLTSADALAATVMSDNPASAAVLEKLGFAWRESGVGEAAARGVLVPVDRFRLSRRQWSADRNALVAASLAAPRPTAVGAPPLLRSGWSAQAAAP
ncbi:GNAT family N-acetyltransferase [Alsobacter sp. SYSU M60028]|uniref:GNAT family N-acetyltransferase n=1 Tax=Alsobacter ponti TaxID=2962936 RepID=A0ABT1LIH8_9HYPH|nr:GNAT family N-acetyltransferase [Alsobacter ponti]MCP8940703.1 GNAT family N-acetyltransferase [Alsobacter ponti]